MPPKVSFFERCDVLLLSGSLVCGTACFSFLNLHSHSRWEWAEEQGVIPFTRIRAWNRIGSSAVTQSMKFFMLRPHSYQQGSSNTDYMEYPCYRPCMVFVRSYTDFIFSELSNVSYLTKQGIISQFIYEMFLVFQWRHYWIVLWVCLWGILVFLPAFPLHSGKALYQCSTKMAKRKVEMCLTYVASSSGDLNTSATWGKNLLKITPVVCLIGCSSGESNSGSGINLASGGLLFSCLKKKEKKV